MKQDSMVGELLGEFFGTMILILFGVGVVASVVAAGVGDHDSITWAWGFGVTLGVYTAARLSGAHLNPAVTIALAAFKGFSWSKVGPYCLAQTAGAFVAAIIVRFTYADFINAIDPNHTYLTQGIFSTSPSYNPDTARAGQPDHGLVRPDRRHRHPRLHHLRRDQRGEQPAAGQPGPGRDRLPGRRDRHGVGRQRRIRHQPGP